VSTSTAQQTATQTSSSSSGLPGGAIGGIVGGIVGAFVILGVLVFLWFRRKTAVPLPLTHIPLPPPDQAGLDSTKPEADGQGQTPLRYLQDDEEAGARLGNDYS
jgi:hypothetical protein